ncbi:GH18 family chitinase [Arcticibacter tournemirensis]|uniref:chitinase n=1 Tax=Arcticibacter tournemirensis TaxID=699437 RepID=A0A5M9HC89_9SPHI|nr:glycosyl hydrolase family 18 protein [Arcticibacter tournemirensis]KAA8482858.1 hypothetical protein F1649_10230 [Arcticibacter tournemirensis]TQM49765.1 GH18 family chitinase [Arcticibacter tournemirensis]
MKLLRLYILLLLLSNGLASPAAGQHIDAAFRIVGYYKGDLVNYQGKINFSQITHLNIAFINPDERGIFHPVPGLTALVSKAHEHHVKVLAAIGGGRAPEYYSSLIAQEKRGELIKNIAGMMNNYGLDGIDVDLEGSLITNEYAGFILQLADAIKPRGLLTAALASNNAGKLDEETLRNFDFINVMSYDKTGPWKPLEPGQHAPYSMAVDDIEFWVSKGLSGSKLNLGLPFYGYGFNSRTVSMSYSKLINSYPGAEKRDELKLNDGGTLYYNGIPSIKSKTKLALEKTGGIMIWQIAQDTTGKKSLLFNIHQVIDNYKIP